MKGIIIFKGKYGATKQYAEWLGKELNLTVVQPGDDYGKENIANCDFVVIGTSVYIGKLQIRDWLKQNVPELASKKIFLFIVCGTPTNQIEKLQAYVKDIPPGISSQCEVYFLSGRLAYQNLSWSDKILLRMGAFLAKDKETKKAMLTDYNEVKKENLTVLLKDIKKFSARDQKIHASTMR